MFIWNGGTPDDHPKWRGCTQVPPKVGGPMHGRRPREKGYPPQGVFCTFPKGRLKIADLIKWRFHLSFQRLVHFFGNFKDNVVYRTIKFWKNVTPPTGSWTSAPPLLLLLLPHPCRRQDKLLKIPNWGPEWRGHTMTTHLPTVTGKFYKKYKPVIDLSSRKLPRLDNCQPVGGTIIPCQRAKTNYFS